MNHPCSDPSHFIFEIKVGIQSLYSIYEILNFLHLQFWICDLEVNAKIRYQSTLWLWPSSIKSATEVRLNPEFLDLKLKRLYIGCIPRYSKIFICHRFIHFLRGYQKSDNQGGFSDFYEFTLYMIFVPERIHPSYLFPDFPGKRQLWLCNENSEIF